MEPNKQPQSFQAPQAAPAAGGDPAQQQANAGGVPQAPQPQAPQTPGLPPTGLQQQLSSINRFYQQAAAAPHGVNARQFQFAQGSQALPSQRPAQGSTSLNQLARTLATQYGLPIGQGAIVDEAGNFLMTPDQIAAASGGSETMGTAAAKMNMIADAIANQQREQTFGQAESAYAAGLGLVQQRGRGSLATLQSGLYRDLGALYAGEEYEAADFSYFIQKEMQDIQMEIIRNQERAARRAGRMAMIGGIAGLIAAPFTSGATLGAGIQGVSQGYATSGWF